MRHFIVLLLLLATLRLGAQAFDGYVVTNAKDTLQGKVRIGTPGQRTIRVYFKAEGADEDVRYEPFQITGFGIKSSNEFYESKYFRIDPLSDDAYAVFMRRDNDGPVRVYQYWNTFAERGYFQTFLQRGDQNLVEVDYTRFRQQMMRFFEDFPQLMAKIERGAFKKKDLVNIAKEYNEWKLRGY